MIDNLIGGRLEPPIEGSYFAGGNPATGVEFSAIADSGSADVQLAVDAATKAFPAWAGMAPKERSRLLLRLAALIEENADELSAAESTDADNFSKFDWGNCHRISHIITAINTAFKIEALR